MRLHWLLVFIFGTSAVVGSAAPDIKTELAKENAWTGEAVPLIVTLYSIGPFSGTAAFDLPVIPQTIVTSAGRPTVGSETIGNESYLTHRHEFSVYTQRTGRIVIPAFRVRYSSKDSFTSESAPREGMTNELVFESKRPTGTESTELVISASEMKIEQVWNPSTLSKVTAGDVIIRTITRQAEGTSAMMLQPVPIDAPNGVQVYVDRPRLEDRSERGSRTAVRIDTVKYQLQMPGEGLMPDVTFRWWDPGDEELKSQTLPGLQFDVAAPAVPVASYEKAAETVIQPGTLFAVLITVVPLLWVVSRPVRAGLVRWQSKYNHPSAAAWRELRKACEANNAEKVYMSTLTWLRTGGQFEGGKDKEHFLSTEPLNEQWDALSRSLFAIESPTIPFDGRAFWNAIIDAQRDGVVNKANTGPLPPLNPSSG